MDAQNSLILLLYVKLSNKMQSGIFVSFIEFLRFVLFFPLLLPLLHRVAHSPLSAVSHCVCPGLMHRAATAKKNKQAQLHCIGKSGASVVLGPQIGANKKKGDIENQIKQDTICTHWFLLSNGLECFLEFPLEWRTAMSLYQYITAI